ncbi:hypothetical protein FRC06_005332 [Ceratobasidium sp. 370]|nr:hypothetical protein FRC06_005332 [Ceratobasidium sp. 370]
MSRPPGDIIKSQLADNLPDPDARPITPKPTTPSGIRRGHVLYDTPEKGEQSSEARSGPRRRRSTEHGDWYRADETCKANIRKKQHDTRRYNAAMCARIEEPPKRNNNDQGNGEVEPLPEAQLHHHQGKTARDLPRSLTPGSTDHEPEPNPLTQQQTSGSQYTYVYETLDHDGLVKYAQEKLCFDLSKSDTQTILVLLQLAEGQQVTQVGSARQLATIDFQQGSPLQVGSGWHLESTPLGMGTSGPHVAKHGSDMVDTSNESSKQQCVERENNMATESESEDESLVRLGPVCVAAERIIWSCSGTLPAEPQPPLPGTHAPPPTREITPATLLASTAPSRTQSFGATPSQVGQLMLPLPMLLTPPRGPVHARLHGKALQHHFDWADHDAQAAEAEATQVAAPDPNEEVDELERTDSEEVPETEANGSIASWHSLVWKPQSTPASAPAPTPSYNRNMASQRTYGSACSHTLPPSNAKVVSPDIEPDDPESDNPDPIT